MLGKELAMTGKIAHVAERKGFELALNGVMKRAQGNRNEGYVEVINAIEKVLGDGWPPQAYENLRTAFMRTSGLLLAATGNGHSILTDCWNGRICST